MEQLAAAREIEQSLSREKSRSAALEDQVRRAEELRGRLLEAENLAEEEKSGRLRAEAAFSRLEEDL